MSSSIDKEIFSYLERLDNMQKKEVLTVIKSFVGEESEVEQGDYTEYVEEMTKRFEDFENGEIKGVTLDEAEVRAKAAFSVKTNK